MALGVHSNPKPLSDLIRSLVFGRREHVVQPSAIPLGAAATSRFDRLSGHPGALQACCGITGRATLPLRFGRSASGPSASLQDSGQVALFPPRPQSWYAGTNITLIIQPSRRMLPDNGTGGVGPWGRSARRHQHLEWLSCRSDRHSDARGQQQRSLSESSAVREREQSWPPCRRS